MKKNLIKNCDGIRYVSIALLACSKEEEQQ